jgi:hypothetical protein
MKKKVGIIRTLSQKDVNPSLLVRRVAVTHLPR